MVKYSLKRIVYIIGVFLIISVIMFSIFKAMPGDPVRTVLEGSKETMDPVQYEMAYAQAREKLGLDDPLYVQYFRWISRWFTGDMGYSIYYRMPVTQVIAAPIANTALINVFNLILCFSFALVLGIQAALKRGSTFDAFVQLITVIGNSLPNFVMAILLILVFAVKLNLFPVSGMYSPEFQGSSFTLDFILSRMHYMTLPLVAMFLSSLGGLTRYVRTNMIESLSLDCIRTARAKGLKEKAVIYSHALRNAIIPIITVTAGWFIGIFSGSVALERMFVWNGMGKIMLDALSNQDANIALSINMVYAAMALFGNLLVDIAYGLADPRIKFE